MWAMSACRLGLVASSSSFVAWAAYALQLHRHGFYVPFVLVDYAWFGAERGPRNLGLHNAAANAFDDSVRHREVDPDVRWGLFS